MVGPDTRGAAELLDGIATKRTAKTNRATLLIRENI
jgi:hypothetical protein